MDRSSRSLRRSGKEHAYFAAVVLAVSGCGGSASETPPPLEPDPHALPAIRESAKDKSPASDDTNEPLPAPQVPPTWGSGRSRAPVLDLPDGG